MSCGVPQGSILGPFFISDLCQRHERFTRSFTICRCDLLRYADDSALLVLDTNVKKIKEQLEKELGNVCDWLIKNNNLYT